MLFLHDLTRTQAPDYAAADAAIAQRLPAGVPVIDCWNKADAAGVSALVAGLALSARTGAGLDALRQELLRLAGWQNTAEGLYIARARHLQALQGVAAHLTQAEAELASSSPALDLLAEELRLAHNQLCSITGEFSSDDLLGEIFSSFCIGK